MWTFHLSLTIISTPGADVCIIGMESAMQVVCIAAVAEEWHALHASGGNVNNE